MSPNGRHLCLTDADIQGLAVRRRMDMQNISDVRRASIWEKTGVKKKYLTPGRSSCMIGKVIVMETFVKQTLLYDFYGELLTERQKQIYESVVLEDQSLREASEEFGISRQGVHDMIRRCTAALEDYEQKLHLVERFVNIRSEVRQIRERAESAGIQEIVSLSEHILEEL